MGALQVVTTIVTIASKSTSVLSSGVTIYEKVSKEDALTTGEKVQVGVESVFCVLQVFELGLHGTTKFAPKFAAKLCGSQQNVEIVNLTAKAAAGALDVTRTITQKSLQETFHIDDFMDVVAVIVFRASDVVSHLNNSETICENKKALGYTVAALDISSAAVTVYRSRDKLLNATQVVVSFLRGRSHPFSNRNNVAVLIPPPGADDAEQANNAYDRVLRDVINWPNLQTIPDLINRDETLSLFKCNHTNRAMRFPVKPRGSNEIVHYEKSVIDELLLNHPVTPPSRWPNGIAFTRENVVTDDDAQFYINQRLKGLADRFEKELNQKNI